MPTSGEVSLYFHIPFCTRKCDYCHFFVLPNEPDLHAEFVDTLLLEWEQKKALVQNRTVKSIYFGGGTPALLAPHYFERILKEISFESSIEITLEANPENLHLDLLKGFKDSGINRLSIGAQSFDDRLLKVLSRTHTSQATLNALKWAKQAGFNNVSIDLMYDLPSQTEENWLKTLTTAVDLPITHLSLYNLTIEPETLFFKKRKQLILPSPEASLYMYESALEILSSNGLIPYEISAFARLYSYSRHNTGYWTGREFLGLGPSAFSYWNQNRFRNVPHFRKYQKALLAQEDPSEEPDHLTPEERKRELLAVELRLSQGVNLKRYAPLDISFDSLIQEGFLSKDVDLIKLTHKGILFYDTVATEII